MYKILFVCSGNICRSPTAHAIMRHLIINEKLDSKVIIDSAGTHGSHAGEAPDPRAIKIAKHYGITMQDLIARKVEEDDYYTSHLILGMDKGHYQSLTHNKPKDTNCTLGLFLEYANHKTATEVPDPYYGTHQHFENTWQLIKEGCTSLLDKIKRNIP